MKKKKNEILVHEIDSTEKSHLFFRTDVILNPVPSFHASHELIYILDGEATAIINKEKYELKKDSICFVNPHQIHYYTHKSIEAVILVFGHNYTHYLRMYYPMIKLKNLMNDESKNKRIRALLMKWLDEGTSSEIRNCGYINLILSELISNYGIADNETNEAEYSQNTIDLSLMFMRYLTENYRNNLTLEGTAQHFSYTKEYFCKLFKNVIGENFTTVLNSIRIEKALEIMQNNTNDYSVNEISTMCGFTNLTTFYRNFKKFGLK